MSRRGYPQKNTRLDYKNDHILFESEHFLAIANEYQKRSHLIIRARRDIESSFQNNLYDFEDPLKDEFWHIIQQIVADTKKPSMLCHHFGGWRSADHFHVHIIVKKRDFAEYVSKKTNNPDNESHIVDLISQKSEQLVKRHLEEFKKPELKQLKAKKPKIDDDNSIDEFDEYRIELDRDYPWVKFIPKEQPNYSKDQKEVQKQLQKYRNNCFTTMFLFAKEHDLTNFRTWVKLAGDTFNINQGRAEKDKIFGIISVYTPDYYGLHPNTAAADEWLERYERSRPDVLACV